MSIKQAYTEIKIPCYYRLENGSTIKHCKQCSFFNGVVTDDNGNITGVDCLRTDIGSINAHVTSFTSGEYLYKLRDYDEDIDGKLSEPYEYCEKCCFSKTLVNGKAICTLRCGTDGDAFDCYEGEIWVKEKRNICD